MSIIRTSHNKERPYVVLDKGGLEDENLSWGARGLWAFLIGKPDHWKISISHLSSQYKRRGGGEKAIYSLLKELIEEGYCERYQEKDANGLFCTTEYVILEFKKCLPDSLQGDAVGGDAVKEGLVYNDIQVNKETTTKEAPSVVVFYDCLKTAKLTESECKTLMCFPQERIILALSFVDDPKFIVSKSRIGSLIWHCKERVPPVHSKSSEEIKKDQQKLADDLSDLIFCRKKTASKVITRLWAEFHPDKKPLVNHNYIDFRNHKLNYDDLEFDKKFKTSIECCLIIQSIVGT